MSLPLCTGYLEKGAEPWIQQLYKEDDELRALSTLLYIALAFVPPMFVRMPWRGLVRMIQYLVIEMSSSSIPEHVE